MGEEEKQTQSTYLRNGESGVLIHVSIDKPKVAATQIACQHSECIKPFCKPMGQRISPSHPKKEASMSERITIKKRIGAIKVTVKITVYEYDMIVTIKTHNRSTNIEPHDITDLEHLIARTRADSMDKWVDACVHTPAADQ